MTPRLQAICLPAHALFADAVGTAKQPAGHFQTMANDADTTGGAYRRKGMKCALEAVEMVRSAVHDDLKGLVIMISAGFTSGHVQGSYLAILAVSSARL
jgi:hypothetical protein